LFVRAGLNSRLIRSILFHLLLTVIISHKHRFIYIKTRKTASTSLEIALSAFCGPDDILTKFSDADEVIRAFDYRW
jgi:hypothetical protein